MKKILTIILVACCVLCSACGNRDNKETVTSHTQTVSSTIAQAVTYVYICEGKHATKYHRYENCRGLGNCRSCISKVKKSTAESNGRTPCALCY